MSASNNIHHNFPALMSDGRNFSSWEPSCKINDEIRDKAKIQSNWQYRIYLTNHGNNIIQTNRLSACDNCCPCWQKMQPIIPNNKYLYKSCSDKKKPYGYHHSDLKNIYLSREELNSKLIAPILTQEQYLRKQQ
tara:strand:+ start:127 stop:528 length:402 start_codon:yes stop_codon:yes gene_type:complete